ncbi:MAG: hypothetical protein OEZ57_09165 [Nitrospirota bacterium]|nr:hypothetical protein [Nitrospirota bacterium]MDH5587805.1 hypothetical protein [Nitrospirota bacterium]MDH5775068.1 hypothetical protein [Nitrospirota bacterium]
MHIIRLLPFVLGGILLLIGIPIDSRAQGSACGCSQQDKLDLDSRIKQVTAAMKEYDALISEWERKEKGAGEPLMLNSTHRRSVQGSVGFRMSGAGDPNARRFDAVTDAACYITVNPAATSCLRGALEDHEAVHKKACEKNTSSNPFTDWRASQRVVDYMKEEQAGYQKELERLTKERNQQQKNCQKLTKLDPSMQRQLEQGMAQQERLQSANNRLESYGKSLN